MADVMTLRIKPLTEYMEDANASQKDVATALGLTPGAISKAVIAERKVYLSIAPSGEITSAHELVRFGRGKRTQSVRGTT